MVFLIRVFTHISVSVTIPLSSKFPEFIERTLKTLKYLAHFYVRVDAQHQCF